MKTAPYKDNERKINAFQKIHTEIKDILEQEKCRSCSCLYTDVLNHILEKLTIFRKYESDHRLVTIEMDFEQWVIDADLLKMHGWLGCEPCLPVPAYNTFNEIVDDLDAEGSGSAASLRTERIELDALTLRNWPVQPGDYVVLNPRKPVAIAVLGGMDIDRLTMGTIGSEIAVIGSIATENLGVEHLVKNLIANPFIRRMIIWGEDVEGHMPGNALVNLLSNGIDKTRRITGARGARPVLKNISGVEVEHLRQQIRGIDLIGSKEMGDLTKQLDILRRQPIQPFEAGLKVDLIEIQEAKPARRLKLDPEGYFVIMVMKDKDNPLLVEHYSNDGILKNMIEGKDSASICATLVEKKLISQLDHAAYLGRELAKAELSIRMVSKYKQDRGQGELF